MNEKPVIIVTGKVPNMQSWYEEKCRRALEELAHLSDTLHRPGDTPNRGWATKEEEIKTHLFNAVRLVLVLANVSCGQRKAWVVRMWGVSWMKDSPDTKRSGKSLRNRHRLQIISAS